MNDETDQTARLRAALSRLADVEDRWTQNRDGKTARQISAEAPDAVIDALLAEVQDTILPARVILSGAETQVELAVAGRRVQGLLAASADLMTASETVMNGEALVDRVLDAEDAGPIAALGGIVRSVAEGAGPFSLRSEISSRLGAEAEPGLTASQLRESWGASADQTSPSQTELEGFLRAIQDVVRGGILVRDGEVVLEVGDPNLGEPLRDVLDAAWPDFEAERARVARDHSDPSLTCWQQSGGPVVSVVSWPDDGIAALAYLPETMHDILSNWNNHLS